MAKKYPTQKHTDLILAEDVRTELHGKLTLTGVYASRYVRLFDQPSDDNPATLRLVFVFFFRDGYGKFDMKARVTQPDGSELAQVDMGENSKNKNASMSIGVGFPAIKITMLGTYRIVATLDEKEFDFNFNIELGDRADYK